MQIHNFFNIFIYTSLKIWRTWRSLLIIIRFTRWQVESESGWRFYWRYYIYGFVRILDSRKRFWRLQTCGAIGRKWRSWENVFQLIGAQFVNNMVCYHDGSTAGMVSRQADKIKCTMKLKYSKTSSTPWLSLENVCNRYLAISARFNKCTHFEVASLNLHTSRSTHSILVVTFASIIRLTSFPVRSLGSGREWGGSNVVIWTGSNANDIKTVYSSSAISRWEGYTTQ